MTRMLAKLLKDLLAGSGRALSRGSNLSPVWAVDSVDHPKSNSSRSRLQDVVGQELSIPSKDFRELWGLGLGCGG